LGRAGRGAVGRGASRGVKERRAVALLGARAGGRDLDRSHGPGPGLPPVPWRAVIATRWDCVFSPGAGPRPQRNGGPHLPAPVTGASPGAGPPPRVRWRHLFVAEGISRSRVPREHGAVPTPARAIGPRLPRAAWRVAGGKGKARQSLVKKVAVQFGARAGVSNGRAGVTHACHYVGVCMFLPGRVRGGGTKSR